MKKGSLLMCLSLFSMMAFSQTGVVEFLKGGQADANKLLQAYMEPYAFALADGLNNGWYNTAETHHLLGFDVTLSASAIRIPNAGKSFDIDGLHLSNNITVTSGGNIAPTVAGKSDSRPMFRLGNSPVEFSAPNGTGLSTVPVPMVQIGFGAIPHTDIIGRYVPEMKYKNSGDEMKIGFWGAGIKHNFKEWVPFLKSLPFDASIFGSYSESNAQSSLNFNATAFDNTYYSVTFTPGADQLLKLKTKTTKVGLIVSKKIAILTLFAGIGQSTSKSNIDLVGEFPVATSNIINNKTEVVSISDPIALDFQSSNLSTDIGFRVKLMLFSFFGSVNHANYTSYNGGVSLGFR